MKVVVQKSLSSRVEVSGEIVGKVSKGIVLLICIENGDTQETLDKAVTKIINLRIFPDPSKDEYKMDLNIEQVQGSILAISQFTLSWDGQKGNRPSFDKSMEPRQASVMFKIFCDKLRDYVKVETGAFGEHMQLFIQNDGPVTFTLNF